ncbi:N-acetyltransferase [Sporosarcina sp. BI001-red]|uniref:GNAT family N-acetyltransferase n=1 Tax=Sporosarcina sp. BI001-red TaxID=2282866 RepID=UPI000E277FEB|nr:GNAT family N-acetyltransferase [Sporosarcina sp. BI001-red]REB05180.1 N-acetyltransferase [Sporosarcina sp. BI001-red]
MLKCSLVPHDKSYAKSMSSLTSAPKVKGALGLTDEQTSLEGTLSFIEFVQEQEKIGKQYSRVILDETGELIGVITLKDIEPTKKTCYIGTWIGHPYWGKGFNALAKSEILYTAFTLFDLDYVFAGAKLSNIRSQKAQEKLPYIRIDVQTEFLDNLINMELQLNEPCMLNVIERKMFMNWYLTHN